jgi:dTDP-4-dehydrorhamnose reductase
MLRVAESDGFGTYHITNQGALSWCDFAALVFRICGVTAQLSPTTSEEYGAPARRPAYSVLANARLAASGLPMLRPIEPALHEYLKEKQHV